MTPSSWRILTMIVPLAVGLTACTAHHTKTPQAICRAHFADVLDAQANTVQGVTEVGPRPTAMGPGHLGTYTGSTPVTVCLVGKLADDLDSAITVTPDSKTYTVWQQGGSVHLMPPS